MSSLIDSFSAFFSAFHFLRPLWLLALPVLWAMAVWLARQQAREGNWAALIDAELLPALRLDNTGREVASRSPWLWLALVWTLAALALAGPSWQQDESAAYRAPAAWMLMLDLSPAMTATDLPPNRATRARYALDDLLGAARDARVGLLAFSDAPYVVAPLTQDIATVRNLLPSLSPDMMPSAGENLAPALKRAGEMLKAAGSKDRQIVMLASGFDDPAAAFATATTLKSQGVTLNVVGVGTRTGAPLHNPSGGFLQDGTGHTLLARLDVDRLQQLANAGGGQYVDLAAMPTLIAHLQASSPRADAAETVHGANVSHWRDAGAWLLLLLLPLAALLARRGWL
jgi:Ca-activated chloride channel family protein